MAKKRNTKSKKSSKEEEKISILDKLKNLRVDDIPEEPKEERKYKPLGKYVKLKITDKHEKFVAMGKRVEKGEVIFAYFTTENGKGVYYFEVIK